jgi:2-methylcitrate dehydratase PrpD
MNQGVRSRDRAESPYVRIQVIPGIELLQQQPKPCKEDTVSSQTEILINHVLTGKFEDLPSNVVNHAKHCIMDTVSCGLGGRKTPDADTLIATMKEIGGTPEATVFGEKARFPFIQAAQINRLLANILDYDDAYMKVGHMTIVVVPVAFALGERLHSSGKEIISAIVQAYETIIRIRDALDPSREVYRTTFERVDTGTPFGVTVVVGKLLKLNAGQMADAFGLTGFTRASRVTYPDRAQKGFPTWMKITCGDSFIPGIHSAFLARNGCPGDRQVLDQGRGYEIIAGSDRYDASRITRGLGQEYEMLRIGFKFYPACRYTSSTADATATLVKDHAIKASDVERVIVTGNHNLAKFFPIYDADHMIQAQFSIPYVVTMVLMGIPRTDWYTQETMNNANFREFQHKVTIEADEALTERFLNHYTAGASVEIITKRDKHFKAHVDYPRGEPENPFKEQDRFDKLTYMASHLGMQEARIDELFRTLNRFEELDDICELTRLLVP